MHLIEISHLTKSFGAIHAVDDVSFCVEEGSFFSFLGVNGAGKSTTIAVLAGKLKRDGGSVKIAGRDVDEAPEEVKRSLGVVFQDSVLDRSLTVEENLRCRAALYGITGKEYLRRREELAGFFCLGELMRRPVGKLSGGQRRRCDVARALLHSPRLLILDEPTTGLDPKTRRDLWNTVDSLRRVRGMTVFLTTHYMEEAADSDRVVILDGGKVMADDTPVHLKERYATDTVTLYHVAEEEVKLLGLPYRRVGEAYRMEVRDSAKLPELIARYPHLFREFELAKGKMDDVFLAVTGRAPEEGTGELL